MDKIMRIVFHGLKPNCKLMLLLGEWSRISVHEGNRMTWDMAVPAGHPTKQLRCARIHLHSVSRSHDREIFEQGNIFDLRCSWALGQLHNHSVPYIYNISWWQLTLITCVTVRWSCPQLYRLFPASAYSEQYRRWLHGRLPYVSCSST